MKSHIDKLKRIKTLQKQLHDLSIWKLNQLQEKRVKLAGDHAAMIEALGHGLLSFGAAAAAATRSIRSIEVEISVAETEHAAQSRRAFEQGAKSKMAERAVDRAQVEFNRDMEKKSLAELIDQSVNSASRKP